MLQYYHFSRKGCTAFGPYCRWYFRCQEVYFSKDIRNWIVVWNWGKYQVDNRHLLKYFCCILYISLPYLLSYITEYLQSVSIFCNTPIRRIQIPQFSRKHDRSFHLFQNFTEISPAESGSSFSDTDLEVGVEDSSEDESESEFTSWFVLHAWNEKISKSLPHRVLEGEIDVWT